MYDAITQIVPADDQPKLANLNALLTGVLLQQDLRGVILPRLGPGIFAYYDSPLAPEDGSSGGSPPSTESAWPFPLVVVVPITDDRAARVPPSKSGTGEPAPVVTVAAALENALHTALAMTALDEKRNQGRSRITTQVVAGTTVTTLDPPIRFAYAVDRPGSRLILSTRAGSIANFLKMAAEPETIDRFGRLQGVAFPADQTFYCIDLDLVGTLGEVYRERLVRTLAARKNRPAGDVERDLTQVLALARLFKAAFVTSRIDRQATTVHRGFGLILHDSSSAAGPRP